MECDYWIEGTKYGAVQLTPEQIYRRSLVWICHRCGTIYARETITGRPDKSWDVRLGCCSNCTPLEAFQYYTPGSIWQPYQILTNNELPFNIVDRELTLHLNNYIKGQL